MARADIFHPEFRARPYWWEAYMPTSGALEAADRLESLNQPGFDFHPLRGKPQRYSMHVNGPWCITFEWESGRALRVDLEQYH